MVFGDDGPFSPSPYSKIEGLEKEIRTLKREVERLRALLRVLIDAGEELVPLAAEDEMEEQRRVKLVNAWDSAVQNGRAALGEDEG